MVFIDHSNTKVLLIGASSFPNDNSIAPIPNIEVNLNELRKTLTDPELIGIPENNIVTSLNENKSQITRKLRDIAEGTRNKKYTLIIYYSGHGILSKRDYQLYLATVETSERYLEEDSLSSAQFREYVKSSLASRKIVLLDCCHSGALLGGMGDLSSQIQSELNNFEGTYVMTSAAENTPSLYAVDKPNSPTFFTGKFLEIVREGMETDVEYCSLRDIYERIEADFALTNLPRPQQSNFNNADQIYFSHNRKFLSKRSGDLLAWEDALVANSKFAFINFRDRFPESPLIKIAKEKIAIIEEEEYWLDVQKWKTFSSIDDYFERYPNGRHQQEAETLRRELKKLEEIRHNQSALAEQKFWNLCSRADTFSAYLEFIQRYPSGRFTVEAQLRLDMLRNDDGKKHEVIKKAQSQEASLLIRGEELNVHSIINRSTLKRRGNRVLTLLGIVALAGVIIWLIVNKIAEKVELAKREGASKVMDSISWRNEIDAKARLNTQIFENPEIPARVDSSDWANYLLVYLPPYAKQAKAAGVPPGQYKVVLTFIVEENGTISSANSRDNMKEGSFRLANAAILLLLNGPEWKPAMHNGKIVRSRKVQPIIFNLEKN